MANSQPLKSPNKNATPTAISSMAKITSISATVKIPKILLVSKELGKPGIGIGIPVRDVTGVRDVIGIPGIDVIGSIGIPGRDALNKLTTSEYFMHTESALATSKQSFHIPMSRFKLGSNRILLKDMVRHEIPEQLPRQEGPSGKQLMGNIVEDSDESGTDTPREVVMESFKKSTRMEATMSKTMVVAQRNSPTIFLFDMASEFQSR